MPGGIKRTLLSCTRAFQLFPPSRPCLWIWPLCVHKNEKEMKPLNTPDWRDWLMISFCQEITQKSKQTQLQLLTSFHYSKSRQKKQGKRAKLPTALKFQASSDHFRKRKRFSNSHLFTVITIKYSCRVRKQNDMLLWFSELHCNIDVTQFYEVWILTFSAMAKTIYSGYFYKK